ncbi:MAG: helix-turn-helix domain-containing protein [Eubacterium sp.]|nr:helix-turn-helix domain-containing protein [Eubacterium sp.]
MMMSIGTRLQELRKQQQMTQEDLAERLDVTRQVISKWERDQSVPSTDKVIELSRIFGVSTDYVLCIDKETVEKVAEKDLQQMVEKKIVLSKAKEKTLRQKLAMWIAFAVSAVAFLLAINGLVWYAQALVGVAYSGLIQIIAVIAIILKVIAIVRKVWSQKIYEYIFTYVTFVFSIAAVVWAAFLMSFTILEAYGHMAWSVWALAVVLKYVCIWTAVVYAIVIVIRLILRYRNMK